MCGIFGICGNDNIIPKSLFGIAQLEYRGYDSAGIAFFMGEKIEIIKKNGQIIALEKELQKQNPVSTCAIAHTRWATHGKPSDENAHPHFSKGKGFALVHNGIIENHLELKREHLKNIELSSTTDTEVAACLIEKFFEGNALEALKRTCGKIKGSYAFALLCSKTPDTIYLAKKDSPLFVASGKDETFFASDATALTNFSKTIYAMKNNEFAILTKKNITFFNERLEIVKKSALKLSDHKKGIDLKNFAHHMHKEIYEIPESVASTVEEYSTAQKVFKAFPRKSLKKIKKIKIIACGTAYHAGLVGKKIIETTTEIDVETEIASEFRYSDPKLAKNTLCIFISQSGETADTIAAVRLCKSLKCRTLAITNVKNSSITFEADHTLFTNAGPEIAVASTKAYNCQLVILYLLCNLLSTRKGSKEKIREEYAKTVIKIKSMFSNEIIDSYENQCKNLAKKHLNSKNIYIIGRQLDLATANEASLKLKEISYLHCEAYPAGELKHGTISSIEDGSLVVAYITQKNMYEKTLNAVHETKSRGAKILIISNLNESSFLDCCNDFIQVPNHHDFFMPLISIIPMQLFSYHFSTLLGINPDKPRNLAKSVTVE